MSIYPYSLNALDHSSRETSLVHDALMNYRSETSIVNDAIMNQYRAEKKAKEKAAQQAKGKVIFEETRKRENKN